MAEVLLSIGSNIDRHRHITAALEALDAEFDNLRLSSIYESEAVGFKGDSFFNLVAVIDTDLNVSQLSQRLRRIETDNGRSREGPRFSARTLDIDILTFDDLVGTFDGILLPRGEILQNAFVLLPLAELVPDQRHPENGLTYDQLWRAYDKTRQKLWTVDFDWRGKMISRSAR